MSTRADGADRGRRGFPGIAIAAAVVVLAVVALLVGRHYFGPGTQPATPANASIGGSFELVDHSGRTVTDADFHGKFMLVYFGYTFCPDVCPMSLNRNAAALDLLGQEAEEIVPVMITVDPERDTPETLASYVTYFDPRFVGLTGSKEAIADVLKTFRVYAGKAPSEAKGDSKQYLVDHSSITYLIGPDGTFLTHFSHGTEPEAMAERLREIVTSQS